MRGYHRTSGDNCLPAPDMNVSSQSNSGLSAVSQSYAADDDSWQWHGTHLAMLSAGTNTFRIVMIGSISNFVKKIYHLNLVWFHRTSQNQVLMTDEREAILIIYINIYFHRDKVTRSMFFGDIFYTIKSFFQF